jgi:hypothetical protein
VEASLSSNSNTDQGDKKSCPGCADKDLPLPDPYTDYIVCPHCGEPDIEIWCYQQRVQCHNCAGWIDHESPQDCPNQPSCKKPDEALLG